MSSARRASRVLYQGDPEVFSTAGAKFETKAIGPAVSRTSLQQQIDTVTQLRDLFERAGRAYRDAGQRADDMVAARTECA